jgi:hypothetical protein
VFLTGHGVGGGLAALLALHLSVAGVATPYVYTMSEPAIWGAASTANVSAALPTYFRLTVGEDPLAHLMAHVRSVAHGGTEAWYPDGVDGALVLCPHPQYDPCLPLQQLADLLADSGLNATASLLLDIAALPSMQEATAARRRSLQPDMGSGPRSGPAGTAAVVVDPTTAKAPGPLDPSHWTAFHVAGPAPRHLAKQWIERLLGIARFLGQLLCEMTLIIGNALEWVGDFILDHSVPTIRDLLEDDSWTMDARGNVYPMALEVYVVLSAFKGPIHAMGLVLKRVGKDLRVIKEGVCDGNAVDSLAHLRDFLSAVCDLAFLPAMLADIAREEAGVAVRKWRVLTAGPGISA